MTERAVIANPKVLRWARERSGRSVNEVARSLQKDVSIVERWEKAPRDAWTVSKSVEYLRKTGQQRDIDFVREHINDLPAAFMLKHGEVVLIPVPD